MKKKKKTRLLVVCLRTSSLNKQAVVPWRNLFTDNGTLKGLSFTISCISFAVVPSIV